MKRLLFVLLFLSAQLLASWGNSPSSYCQLKYSFEDSVRHNYMLECNKIAKAGGNKPEIFNVNIGNSKNIELNFQTFSAKDIIIVEYQGDEIYNSGCVGTNNWKKKKLKTDGFTSKATVKVLPNCKGSEPSTRWKFFINCD